MPEDSRFVGNSIEELLVALAEGVRDAQVALNAMPLLDQIGRPLVNYHLPYLDFIFAVEMTTAVSSNGRSVTLVASSASSSQSTNEVRSQISGRIIATPPGDGLPVPRIEIAAGSNIGGQAAISVRVSNTAGELLANQQVELNIDHEASKMLSSVRQQFASFVPSVATRLTEALLTTGTDGTASTSLLIDDKDQHNLNVLVVVANIGLFSARAAVPTEVVG